MSIPENKTSVQNKLLNNKLLYLNDMIKEITMDLRCCGNCLNMQNTGKCKLNKHEYQRITCSFRVCADWTYDGLGYGERRL